MRIKRPVKGISFSRPSVYNKTLQSEPAVKSFCADYLLDPLFDAFNGLIFWDSSSAVFSICVADGHPPMAHFPAGSG